MHFLSKYLEKINVQVTVVTLCILCVCVGTQQIQTVAWNTGIIELSRDSFGVLMAVIIFTNYKWDDFVRYKLIYIIWSVSSILAGIFIIPIAFEQRLDFLKADTIIIALGIWLGGNCVVHTFFSFFKENYRPKFYRPLLIIWIVMMGLMIFSRSNYLWPECYFVLFLCYYLTPQTITQRKNVTIGLANGIILGFIFIQAHSLLFRPYDRVRYYGNFCNPNHNCMFLCMCLGAILAKILLMSRQNIKKLVWIFYFLLAEACCSFIFMTICRSGYLTTVVLVLMFLVMYCRIKEKKVFFKMGVLFASAFVIVMPITYLAVRYIPTIHPHVLFYFQEGYSEDRVHSGDPRNSEKFVTFKEVLEGAFGRTTNLIRLLDRRSMEDGAEGTTSSLIVSKAHYIPVSDLQYCEGETSSDKIPALTDEEVSNDFLVRYTIYKWYLTHLSLRGMPYEEQGFQLAKNHWIQDTHNIYLDYGINFGYPVMILFTFFAWWGVGRLCRQGMKKKDIKKLTCALFAVIPLIFGLLDFAWGAGMISSVAFYMSFKEMFTV